MKELQVVAVLSCYYETKEKKIVSCVGSTGTTSRGGRRCHRRRMQRRQRSLFVAGDILGQSESRCIRCRFGHGLVVCRCSLPPFHFQNQDQVCSATGHGYTPSKSCGRRWLRPFEVSGNIEMRRLRCEINEQNILHSQEDPCFETLEPDDHSLSGVGPINVDLLLSKDSESSCSLFRRSSINRSINQSRSSTISPQRRGGHFA